MIDVKLRRSVFMISLQGYNKKNLIVAELLTLLRPKQFIMNVP